MRFEKHLKEDFTNILGYAYLCGELNEVSDTFLLKLQSLGQKVGIKVRKSKTFQDQMKNAGKGVLHLMKLVAEYSVHADVMDSVARKKLEQDMKTQFSKVRREDVVSFIVNLDKSFLGLTSIPRHVLQNVLGITITTFDNWQTDQDYVEKTMPKVIAVLKKIGDDEDVELARRIYKNISGHAI